MNRSIFLLAKFENKIELVQVSNEDSPKIGQQFDRMPGRDRQSWTVIKIFDHEEHDQIVAIITLMGIAAAKKLFASEIPERSFISDDDPILERVDPRMGIPA